VDYLFITKEKFEQWLSRGELLEHAVVYGEYKGIPRPQVGGGKRGPQSWGMTQMLSQICGLTRLTGLCKGDESREVSQCGQSLLPSVRSRR